MQCEKRHKELDEQGIGKCSVPMWYFGLPAGFCDKPAYGEPVACKQFRDRDGVLHRFNGRYDGYVPFLACPTHGGPNIRVFKDGNQWCAVHPDFVDLQNDPAGFGNTREEAIKALKEKEKQRSPMPEEIYEFVEPHPTGGDATVRITRKQIIEYMRNHPKRSQVFAAVFHRVGLIDDDLVEQFCINNWAHLVVSKKEQGT